MKKMDTTRLIQLFNDTATGNSFDESIPDISSHGYIILGMVIKGVENYYILCDMIQRKYSEEFEKIKDSLTRTYFLRIYQYLIKLDIESPSTILQALDHDTSSIEYTLNHLIRVFEKEQEYEKCAKILEIQKALEI